MKKRKKKKMRKKNRKKNFSKWRWRKLILVKLMRVSSWRNQRFRLFFFLLLTKLSREKVARRGEKNLQKKNRVKKQEWMEKVKLWWCGAARERSRHNQWVWFRRWWLFFSPLLSRIFKIIREARKKIEQRGGDDDEL